MFPWCCMFKKEIQDLYIEYTVFNERIISTYFFPESWQKTLKDEVSNYLFSPHNTA